MADIALPVRSPLQPTPRPASTLDDAQRNGEIWSREAERAVRRFEDKFGEVIPVVNALASASPATAAFYVRNLTDGLYYQVLCNTFDGVVTFYPNPTGVASPAGTLRETLYLPNLTTGLFHQLLCDTFDGVVTFYPNPTGIP